MDTHCPLDKAVSLNISYRILQWSDPAYVSCSYLTKILSKQQLHPQPHFWSIVTWGPLAFWSAYSLIVLFQCTMFSLNFEDSHIAFDLFWVLSFPFFNWLTVTHPFELHLDVTSHGMYFLTMLIHPHTYLT